MHFRKMGPWVQWDSRERGCQNWGADGRVETLSLELWGLKGIHVAWTGARYWCTWGGEATSPNTPVALLRHLHFLEKVVGRPLVGWNTAIQCPFKHGPQRSKDRGLEPSQCWKQKVAGDFGAIIYAGKEEWGNRCETASGSFITSIQGPFGRLQSKRPCDFSQLPLLEKIYKI